MADQNTAIVAKRTDARWAADEHAGLLSASLDTPATPERIFQALTNPAELERWWG